jgi:hypothetical protein
MPVVISLETIPNVKKRRQPKLQEPAEDDRLVMELATRLIAAMTALNPSWVRIAVKARGLGFAQRPEE